MRWLKNRKITFKQYIATIAFFVLCIVLSVISTSIYSTLRKSSEKAISAAGQARFDTVFSSLQSAVDGTIKTCSYLTENERFKNCLALLTETDIALFDKVRAHSEVTRMAGIAVSQNELITDIGVQTGSYFFGSGQLMGTSKGRELVKILPKSSSEAVELKKIPSGSSTNSYYITFSFYDGENRLYNAYILLKSDLDGLLGQSPAEWAIFENSLAPLPVGAFKSETADNHSGFFSALQGGTQNSIGAFYQAKLSGMDWTVAYLPSQADFGECIKRVKGWNLCLLLFSAAHFAILSKLLARSIVRPLSLVAALLKSYRADKGYETDEVSYAQKAFNVRENLLWYLLVTVLLPSLSFLLLFSYVSQREMNRLENMSQEAIIENKAQELSSFFYSKEQALARIVYNDAVSTAIIQSSAAEQADNGRIYEAIEENIYFSLDDGAVNIYDKTGQMIFSNHMFGKKKQPPEELYNKIGWNIEENLLNQTCVVMTQRNLNFRNYGTLGYTQLSYKYDNVFQQSINADSTISGAMLLDVSGSNIVTGESTLSPQQLKKITASAVVKTPDKIWFIAPVEHTDWFLSGSIDINSDWFKSETLSANKQFFLLVFFAAVAGLFGLSYLLIRPVNKTNRMLLFFEPGNPEIRLDENSFIDEIGEINKSFNDMAARIDELIDDIVTHHHYAEKLESEKKTAEITALQMQINPHFLSNTIETIAGIVQEGQSAQACDMLYALNNLFRYGISKADYLIPIQQEMRNSKAYTDIMKVRHAKLNFVWEIEDSVLNCHTIKLLLQPLIENAIYHGLYRSGKEGTVCIKIWRKSKTDAEFDTVCFEVADNGAGMDEDKLQKLYTSLEDTSEQGRIGLYNVQARLRLHYGKNCRLKITSSLGNGTKVMVEIPALCKG